MMGTDLKTIHKAFRVEIHIKLKPIVWKKTYLLYIIFLDIRKAFDSINHNILLSKMRSNFGISGNELLWFESYLTNREQQCVVMGYYPPLEN